MIKRSLTNFAAGPLLLVLAMSVPTTGYSGPEPGYSYSDEWTVVSAPPPSGPYRPVHIDPRVPGQGVTPPVTAVFDPAASQAGEPTAGARSAGAVTDTREQAAGVTADVVDSAGPDRDAARAVSADAGDEVQPANAAEAQREQLTESVTADVADTDGPVVDTTGAVSAEAANEAQSGSGVDATQVQARDGTAAEMTDTPEPPLAEAGNAATAGAPGEMQPARATQAAPAGASPAPVLHQAAGEPEQPGAVLQPPPVTAAGWPPFPEEYGHMMPPAAGERGLPSAPPADRPPVPGPYGRMLPRSPGFNYPAPAWQSGRSGAPGYMNMPPFGYYRGPAYRPEGEVPPPGSYQGQVPYGGGPHPAP